MVHIARAERSIYLSKDISFLLGFGGGGGGEASERFYQILKMQWFTHCLLSSDKKFLNMLQAGKM